MLQALAAAAALALALGIQIAPAQTWSTVDDFQYALGGDSEATGIAQDLSAAIYVAGYGSDSATNYHALIQKSSDSGATWTIVDDFIGFNQAGYLAVTADPSGVLYAAGNYYTNKSETGYPHLFIRQSVDGATWSTVDDAVLGTPSALTTDAAGNVYVAGSANISSNWAAIVRKGTVGSAGITWSNIILGYGVAFNSLAKSVLASPAGLFVGGSFEKKGGIWVWTILRSVDGGATWSTVDSYSLGSGSTPGDVTALSADSSGIYAVGYATKGSKANSVTDWIVRRSTDSGRTWATIDDFQYPFSTSSQAFAVSVDSLGNHYAAGWGGNNHWVVRKNLANTSTWSIVDDFVYASGYSSRPAALLAAPSGNVFAAGVAGSSSTSDYYWLVRKQ